MHFVFSCFKIWLLINSKHITSQSWFKIERNVIWICCRSMGPLMSMVTCSVTSVTTTVSSVFFAPVLVSYIVHTDHGFFSGICCNLKSFWIIPCQSWQWTRSGGIVKTVDFRIQQILKSTFVNILHLKDFELVDGADLDLETPWTRSASRRRFSSPFSSCDAISSPEQFDSSAWIGI